MVKQPAQTKPLKATRTSNRLKKLFTLSLIGLLTSAIFLSPNSTQGEGPESETGQATSIQSAHMNSNIIPIPISVTDTVIQPNVKRMGINLGHIDQFGAAQLMQNIIKNPGFEAGQYGMIFNAEVGLSGGGIIQAVPDFWRTEWNNEQFLIGQQEGFWNGADITVLTGAHAGKTGKVSAFSHTDGLYTFGVTLDGIATGLEKYDAFAVQQKLDGYTGARDVAVTADPNESRPGSSGTQAIKLTTHETSADDFKNSFNYYLDSTDRDGDHTAGKLFKIKGEWHFEIWAKGAREADFFDVYFKRQCADGGGNFFYRRYNVTTEWQQFAHDFSVEDGVDARSPNTCGNGEEGVLEFHIRIPFGNEPIWIDDVYLGRANSQNLTPFSDTFVNALKEYDPGIVRNWGDQLGSDLDNELADSFSRRTVGHGPDKREARNFHFGLHDFLQLAHELDAEPWYVIPPTFSAAEMANLMAYLSAPAGSHPYADKRAGLGQTAPWTDTFNQIHLEFGNEMWGSNGGNDPFRGATLRGGERLGELANSRFGSLKASPYFAANEPKLNLIIGGQVNVPSTQGVIENASDNHSSIALSPYFAYDFERFATADELFYPLFARPQQAVATGKMAQSKTAISQSAPDTQLAVYDINFHTTGSDLTMPLDTRNAFVSSMGGGLALPLHMLTYLKEMGVKNQAAFTALQYSHQVQEGEYVKLWGLMRDLEGTGNKRPTWLGAEVTNRALQGDLITSSHTGHNPMREQAAFNEIESPINVPYVQTFAFKEGSKYFLLLFNLHLDAAQQVAITPPSSPHDYVSLTQIAPESIWSNNETAETVTIEEMTIDNLAEPVLLPKHSLTLLEWDTADRPPLAADDTFIVEYEVTLTAKGNLLANDRIEERGSWLVELLSPPAAGVLSLNSDGSFEYSPPAGFSGEETATYRIFDGQQWSQPAGIRFVIFPENLISIYLPLTNKP